MPAADADLPVAEVAVMRTISALYRYPIKGLSPERLQQVALRGGRGFPGDRQYALTDGSWVYDPMYYTPRPKIDFLMLMLHEQLALLKVRVDDDSRTLHLQAPNGRVIDARLDDGAEVARIEGFFAEHLADKLQGRPRLVNARDQSFTDVSVVSPSLMSSISLVNLASVRDLGEKLGVELDPLRFRANVYFDGGEPWEELSWLDRPVRLGSIGTMVVMKTRRCAATNVNPDTGERDLGVPQALMKHYRHVVLGVYAEVLSTGELHAGDALQLV